jgi:hypothetical protein
MQCHSTPPTPGHSPNRLPMDESPFPPELDPPPPDPQVPEPDEHGTPPHVLH